MPDIKAAISPSQCRAARGLLSMSQSALATAAAVSEKTIADFEREVRAPYLRTLRDIRAALESAGVDFIPEFTTDPTNGQTKLELLPGGPGVRLKAPGER